MELGFSLPLSALRPSEKAAIKEQVKYILVHGLVISNATRDLSEVALKPYAGSTSPAQVTKLLTAYTYIPADLDFAALNASIIVFVGAVPVVPSLRVTVSINGASETATPVNTRYGTAVATHHPTVSPTWSPTQGDQRVIFTLANTAPCGDLTVADVTILADAARAYIDANTPLSAAQVKRVDVKCDGVLVGELLVARRRRQSNLPLTLTLFFDATASSAEDVQAAVAAAQQAISIGISMSYTITGTAAQTVVPQITLQFVVITEAPTAGPSMFPTPCARTDTAVCAALIFPQDCCITDASGVAIAVLGCTACCGHQCAGGSLAPVTSIPTAAPAPCPVLNHSACVQFALPQQCCLRFEYGPDTVPFLKDRCSACCDVECDFLTPTTAPTAPAPTSSPRSSAPFSTLPSALPTLAPWSSPSATPTPFSDSPTLAPSATPSTIPTSTPTIRPTAIPTVSPTACGPDVYGASVCGAVDQPRCCERGYFWSICQTSCCEWVCTNAPTTSEPTAQPTHSPTSPTVSPTSPTTSPSTGTPTGVPSSGIPTTVPTRSPTRWPDPCAARWTHLSDGMGCDTLHSNTMMYSAIDLCCEVPENTGVFNLPGHIRQELAHCFQCCTVCDGRSEFPLPPGRSLAPTSSPSISPTADPTHQPSQPPTRLPSPTPTSSAPTPGGSVSCGETISVSANLDQFSAFTLDLRGASGNTRVNLNTCASIGDADLCVGSQYVNDGQETSIPNTGACTVRSPGQILGQGEDVHYVLGPGLHAIQVGTLAGPGPLNLAVSCEPTSDPEMAGGPDVATCYGPRSPLQRPPTSPPSPEELRSIGCNDTVSISIGSTMFHPFLLGLPPGTTGNTLVNLNTCASLGDPDICLGTEYIDDGQYSNVAGSGACTVRPPGQVLGHGEDVNYVVAPGSNTIQIGSRFASGIVSLTVTCWPTLDNVTVLDPNPDMCLGERSWFTQAPTQAPIVLIPTFMPTPAGHQLSEKSCKELRAIAVASPTGALGMWAYRNQPGNNRRVCANSILDGRCWGQNKTFRVPVDDASQICRSVGARLCTVNELLSGFARGTKCDLDTKMVWAEGGATVVVSGKGHRIDEANRRRILGLRCCADGTPDEDFPPTPPPTPVPGKSRLPCAVLSRTEGFVFRAGQQNTCAASGIAGTGSAGSRCYNTLLTNVGYDTAYRVCDDAGARLCTREELSSDFAKGTRCSLDAEYVWSASSCELGVGYHTKVAGSFSNRGGNELPPTCVSDTTRLGVRCCADAQVNR